MDDGVFRAFAVVFNEDDLILHFGGEFCRSFEFARACEERVLVNPAVDEVDVLGPTVKEMGSRLPIERDKPGVKPSHAGKHFGMVHVSFGYGPVGDGGAAKQKTREGDAQSY